MITTAFGQAELVEEVAIPQSSELREFNTHIQLLKAVNGEELVRFAYSTDATARRGPVTLRMADLRRLGKALTKAPKLRRCLTRLAGGT